jgi:hypothetical protein
MLEAQDLLSVLTFAAMLAAIELVMAGLAVQNFVSAAVGMAVVAGVIRGFARRSGKTLGNCRGLALVGESGDPVAPAPRDRWRAGPERSLTGPRTACRKRDVARRPNVEPDEANGEGGIRTLGRG